MYDTAAVVRYVMVHTAAFWAKSFMTEFREVCDGQRESTRKLPTLPIKEVCMCDMCV